jgi:hypothetical protein
VKSFQNLSYKTLFTILFFAIAGIIFFLKIGGKTTTVSAAWWDDMWHYRKAISVSNSSGSNLTDFQVAISVGTSQLVADGKMQSDCDDIRITDINGNLLPHWIHPDFPCNTDTTKIFVKVPSIPTSNATIFLYYGNFTATNSQNPSDVFYFWDDFNGSTLDTSKWNTSGTSTHGSVTVANGYASLDNTINEDTVINSQNSYSQDNYIIESRFKINSASNDLDGKVGWKNGATAGIGPYNDTVNFYEYPHRIFTPTVVQGTELITTSWKPFTFQAKSGNIKSTFGAETLTSSTTHSYGNGNIYFYTNSSTSTHIDFFALRKYASTDPTPSLQSEELGGGPIAYWKFDEGIGTTAYDSAGTFNGTLSGSTLPSWQTEDQCISGKCLYFNNRSNVQIPDNSSFNTDTMTIEMWLKLTDTGQWFGAYRADNTGNSWYFYYDSQNGSTFTWYTNSTRHDIQVGTPGLNTWHYYSIVISPNNQYAYQDGKLISHTTVVNGLTATNGVIKFGEYSSPGGYNLTGYIDEAKIYPYSRTAAQIKLDYNSRGSSSGSSVNLGVQSNTAPDLNSSLVAYYKFDENNGTTVYDSTSNATGTVYYGATWMRTNLGIGLSLGGYGSYDYISLSNQPLNNATTWSISSRLKYINKSYTFEFFLGQNDTSTGKILLRHNGYISFRGTNGTYYDFSTTSAEINNLDSTLLFISDGNIIKLYINGIYKSSVTPASTSISLNTIGNAWTDTVWTSAFVINELKIYNTALTDEQIKQDYNAGSAIQFGSTNQTIGGTTTSLDYCIPGDTTYCASPVAEWKMDEGVGTSIVDTSGNNNTGTLGTGNSAPTWTQGKIGKALNFDGSNDYVRNTSNLISSGNFTYSAWFNTKDSTVSQAIFNLRGTEAAGTFIGTRIVSSKLVTYIDGTVALTGATTLLNNTWYFLSVTYDAAATPKTIVYLNSIQDITGTAAADYTYNQTLIGSRTTSTLPFNGKIDNVKIYNYARTPAQVAYDYNRGGPVGWWKFDECQGNIAYDWSGIGNTGVINIGTSGTQNSLGTCAVGTSAAWTNGATGHTNSSLNFDGTDDYVNCGNNISTPNEITFSGWIKPSNVTLSTQSISAFSPSAQYNYWLYLDNKNIQISAYSSTYPNLTISNIIQTNNIWYHIVFTAIKGGSIKVFLNGTKIGEGSAGNTYTASGNVTIGDLRVDRNLRFNGQIDDVRIYNYALTSEQVKQVYNGGAVSFQ